jgi:hypothetical protein
MFAKLSFDGTIKHNGVPCFLYFMKEYMNKKIFNPELSLCGNDII